MAENLLVKMRTKKTTPEASKSEKVNPLIAARKGQLKIPTVLAKPEGQPYAEVDPEAVRRDMILAQFKQLPWYAQAAQAADDLARLGAKGASFNALDRALGPEQQRMTEEAGIRAGLPGDIAEIGGMVVSPVTRAVGAAGTALKPVGRGLTKALARLGVTGTEGAVLGGTEAAINNGDIASQAQLGGGIAAGAETLFKHIIPKSAGTLAALLSKVPREQQREIFRLASESADSAADLKSVQASAAPGKTIDKITGQRAQISGVPIKNFDKVEDKLAQIYGDTTTSSGFSALDPIDAKVVQNLIDYPYIAPGTKEKGSLSLKYLDDLVSYLENTKVPTASSKTQSGRITEDVHKAVREAGAESDPRFAELMKSMDDLAAIRTAGTQTAKWMPEKNLPGTVLQLASLAAIPGAGAAGILNPLLAAAIGGTAGSIWAASSPKLVGKIARKAGSAKRKIKKATGGAGYGTLGLSPGAADVFMEDAKGNRYDKDGKRIP